RTMAHPITGTHACPPPATPSRAPPDAPKTKEGKESGSDVLTFHSRPQTTCPAHTAPAPRRLQDRADATNAVVHLTHQRHRLRSSSHHQPPAMALGSPPDPAAHRASRRRSSPTAKCRCCGSCPHTS